MKVSVIIPTYNGSKKIANLLKALEKQSNKNFEVVIVNDGSTDNTVKVIENLGVNLQDLRLINQKNSGRSGVRNSGAKVAYGDLLIFYDDDMRPNSDSVGTHIQHHENYPGSILTSSAEEELLPDSTDFLRFKSTLNRKWIEPLQKFKNIPLSKDKVFITAANFSISRELFESLGGFDRRLFDSEDYDLAVRAFKANIPLFFNADAYGWHDDICSCNTFIKRQRQYQIAIKSLLKFKPWLLDEGFFKKDRKLNKGKRIFFRLLAFPFWISAVDREIFKSIPKKLRYRLYDYIVTANAVYYPEKVKL